MPTHDTETDYSRRLEAEARKWGDHLQVEATGRWNAWLDHPLIAENYRQRRLMDGMGWEEWVRHQLGGAACRSLDLGCGAGEKSFAIHAAGASSYLEGYDISPARIAQAEQHRLAAGIPGHFQVADVNRLQLSADSYDLIFSNHSFHHFLDLEHVMEQVHRALTPGGYFILEEYVGPTQFQWTDKQMALVSTRLSLIPERLRVSSAGGVVKFAEGRPTVEQVVAESPFESIRSSEIAPLFRKYFEVVAIKPLGGTLQQLLYNGIVHHFALDDEEAMEHMKGILALENELIDAGFLPSDFMLLIGRRKTADRNGDTNRRAFAPMKSGTSKAAVLKDRTLSETGDHHETMRERPWQIGICGTFDVANYGDLLFPLIAESELTERLGAVTLHPFSYNTKAPPHWPYEVTSVTELPEMIQSLDAMLIGGGFLIRFDKEVAPGYTPPSPEIHHPTGYWLTPALLALQHDVPVLWNAPSMHCNEIPAWADPLMKMAFSLSRYVSVRDEPSAATLEQLTGAPVAVVPDSAFRISRLLNPDQEPSPSFTDLRNTTGLDRPYIVVQATMGLEGFLRFIKRHASSLQGYRFLALPIGPILGENATIVDADGLGMVHLPEWPAPLVIAELIARAEAVVGHSYHLMITALASGVPVFTGQDMSVGKYTALQAFESIFALPAGGEPELDWFCSRLGKKSPSARVRTTCQPLSEHWDRIAEGIRLGAPKTSFALNRFWQSLPTLLENAPQAHDGAATAKKTGPSVTPPHVAEAIQLLSAARSESLEAQRRLVEARLQLDRAQREASEQQARLDDAMRLLSTARLGLTTETTRKPRILNIERIRNHRLETTPFQWACIRNLYEPAHAEMLANTYPCDHFKLLSAHGGEKDYEYEARSLIGMGKNTISHPEDLSEAWQALAFDLLTPEYRAGMTKLTGLDLTESPMEVNVFHFGPGCSLGSHCDLPDKLVTHVLYFNRSWNTTDGGCLNILRSADMADLAAEIPPLVGNSAIIVRSDHSWHAVPRVVKHSSQSRRSVTVTFYRPGSVSSMWPPDDTTPLHRYQAADLSPHTLPSQQPRSTAGRMGM